MTSPEIPKSYLLRLSATLTPWILSLIVGSQLYFLTGLHAASQRITVIESSRFTGEEGAQVREDLAALKTRIKTLPLEGPPEWFIARVDRIEVHLNQISHDLQELKRTMK